MKCFTNVSFFRSSFEDPELRFTSFRSRLPFLKVKETHFKGCTHFEVKKKPCNVEPYHMHKALAQSTGLSSTTSIEYRY
uniref:Uncharacterized protein n=1 Tax=Rhizophagus irregularis (strain DAOM 181602 / DAOM 197198 / MUCL 43194) TaxID=747089 RepID=U9THP7_RHIID